MKLKYYLRGLGIGIFVTALSFCILDRGEAESLSDEQIKVRAAALGMVDSSSLVLTDVANPTEEKVQEDLAEGQTQEQMQEETQTGEQEQTIEESQSTEQEQSEEQTIEESQSTRQEKAEEQTIEESQPTKEEQSQEQKKGAAQETEQAQSTESAEQKENAEENSKQAGEAATDDTVTIVINKGYGSDKVSRILEDAGLVEDAKEFDKYLCDKGYSRRISAGEYKIAPGTGEKDIAEIITKNR